MAISDRLWVQNPWHWVLSNGITLKCPNSCLQSIWWTVEVHKSTLNSSFAICLNSFLIWFCETVHCLILTCFQSPLFCPYFLCIPKIRSSVITELSLNPDHKVHKKVRVCYSKQLQLYNALKSTEMIRWFWIQKSCQKCLTSQYFISRSCNNGFSAFLLLLVFASTELFKIRLSEWWVPWGQNIRWKLFWFTRSKTIGCRIFCISSFYASNFIKRNTAYRIRWKLLTFLNHTKRELGNVEPLWLYCLCLSLYLLLMEVLVFRLFSHLNSRPFLPLYRLPWLHFDLQLKIPLLSMKMPSLHYLTLSEVLQHPLCHAFRRKQNNWISFLLEL